MRFSTGFGWMTVAVLGSWVSLGCSRSVEQGGGGAGGGGGNPCFPDSCSGPSSTAAQGADCGAEVCSPSEFCDFPDDKCGKPGGIPTCSPKPTQCDVDVPKCGCDGKVYPGSCQANQAGVDLSGDGGCVAPTGTFACGSIFCASATEYCYRFAEGFAPTFNTCKPLPAMCTANGAMPTCSCLAGEPVVAGQCEAVPGGLVINDHM